MISILLGYVTMTHVINTSKLSKLYRHVFSLCDVASAYFHIWLLFTRFFAHRGFISRFVLDSGEML